MPTIGSGRCCGRGPDGDTRQRVRDGSRPATSGRPDRGCGTSQTQWCRGRPCCPGTATPRSSATSRSGDAAVPWTPTHDRTGTSGGGGDWRLALSPGGGRTSSEPKAMLAPRAASRSTRTRTSACWTSTTPSRAIRAAGTRRGTCASCTGGAITGITSGWDTKRQRLEPDAEQSARPVLRGALNSNVEAPTRLRLWAKASERGYKPNRSSDEATAADAGVALRREGSLSCLYRLGHIREDL